MKFSKLVEADIERAGDMIIVRPHRLRKEMSFGVFTAVTMIRNAVSYFTRHHAVHRAVKDLDDNIVCIVVFPFAKASKGLEQYWQKVGFGKYRYDHRKMNRDMFANHNYQGYSSKQIEKLRWRTTKHKSARSPV